MKTYYYLFLAFLISACAKNPVPNGNDNDSNGYVEPVPATITFSSAHLSYYGDDYESDVSDLWTICLQKGKSSANTSEEYNIYISVNATHEKTGKPDITMLQGTYRMSMYSGDMTAGTFNPGYMENVDTPDGIIQRPTGSYFVKVENGEEVAEADLLREGYCSIVLEDDGSVSIEGIMVGTEFRKRYFEYKGSPEISEYSGWISSGIPNTNLSSDIELKSLSQIRIVDKGDSYCLGNESYRHFEVYLAEKGIDLSSQWPAGTGELMRIEIFVPWETSAEDGIPDGVYKVPENVPVSGGLYKDDIAPYRIIPGYPDKFTGNTGTWYQKLENGKWIDYARITGGTITVERTNGKCLILLDLEDCGEPSHSIKGEWSEK